MSLKSAHSNIKDRWNGNHDCLESYETVKTVQAHRDYWKPKDVRLVLLAESHVYTSDIERNFSKIDLSKVNYETLPKLENIPTDFVRFIYCLGCGENELLDNKVENNLGSPQFWKMFQACISGPEKFREILKTGESNFEKRVGNKVQLLTEMKDRGIWLVDASVVALYPKKNRQTNLKMAIETSYEDFIKPLLNEIGNPKVIVIGKGVGEIVRGKALNTIGIITQPNAFLSSEEQQINFNNCHEMCSQIAYEPNLEN